MFQATPCRQIVLPVAALLLMIISDNAAAQTPRERNFAFEYVSIVKEIPEAAKEVTLWLPLPHNDPYQVISDLRIESPYPYQVRSAQYGNKMLLIRVKDPKPSGFSVVMRFNAKRREHINLMIGPMSGPQRGGNRVNATARKRPDSELARWLQPDRLVPLDDKIKEWAQEVVEAAGAKTDLEKAHAVYKHIIQTVKYDKSGQGWGRGDIYYACDARRGNCTDFHAIFIGYCRSLGIPARFAIGFPLPTERGQGQIGGYHCWAEFYVKELGWVPVDASEAAKDPSRREYFFGAHDENRVEFTRGRDLTLNPRQSGQPLNYFIYPYLEVDGKPFSDVDKVFKYRDLSRSQRVAARRQESDTAADGSNDFVETSNSNPDLAKEVEALKRRVEELESQNRTMGELLSALKIRLDAPDSLFPALLANDLQMTRIQPMAAVLGRESIGDAPVGSLSITEPPASATPAAQAKPAHNGEPVHWGEILSQGNQIKFYGFLRLDLDIDSQRPNNDQIPFFVTSADPAIGKAGAGDFSMHPRLTRFGVDYSGPRIAALGESKLSGKLELDFENGGSESRQIIRIRHGYLKMDWDRFSILAGQTWDVVSPLFPTVNNDTLMWNAGNVGDRRPQFRVAFEQKAGRGQWSLIGAAGLMGAVDLQDLDNNGYRDGEESGRPDLQARIGYSRPLWVKDQRAGFGLSGFYGWLNTSRAVAGRSVFRSQLVNLDYTLPLSSRLALRGEGWWGRNLSDVRGGAGQGLNLLNGREIRSRGGWSELNLKLSRYWSIHPGFTTDDPVDSDIPGGGRIRNRAFYFADRISPGGNFLIGVDYLRWRTDYSGYRSGSDNRVNLFFQYGF